MRQIPKRLHRQRAQLDARLAKLRPALGQAIIPHGGWLKAVRESLGMSAEQLGHRLGISKQTVLQQEGNEARKALTLASLDRAARALGCRVAYAIVPERSLEAAVDERARLVAERRLERVAHSMRLEEQTPPSNLHRLQVAELAAELKSKLSHLWDEP
jgi:predicted DNA-binding mobile mystery protein A